MSDETRKDKKLKLPELSLGGGLAVVIIAACLIVGVGYSMYWHNPNRKYDLARPGERDNQAVRVQVGEPSDDGPVTKDAVRLKIEYLEQEIDALEGVNDFKSADMEDQAIRLVPGDQPSQ